MKMLPNVFRNVVTKSATRNYPAEVRTPFENVRGELTIRIEDCIFCGICSKKCPSQCISVSKKEAVWECDPFLCVYCGLCVEACPTKCLDQDSVYRAPTREREYISLKGEVKKKKKKETKAA